MEYRGANDDNDEQRIKTEEIPPAVLEIHKGRPIRLNVKILVPVHDHPNFNFVGKLLGPKGNSLQRLQEATQTRMAILGKGSMRNRVKEEELRNSGDSKHAHLHEDLHVDISTFAPAAEAYARIAHAIAEIKRFLVPDYYDDIRQQQLRELAVLNGAKKQQVVSATNEKRNGYDSMTPLSSPTTSVNSPPPEATRGSSVTLPPTADCPLYPSRTAAPVMRMDTSSGGKNRIPRLQFPFPRTSSSARVHPGYRRLPLYGGLTSEAPNVLIPENEVNLYEDSYHAEIHEQLYEPDFSLISEPESCFDYDGSLLNDHQGRSYERNGYGDCSRTIPPSGVLHRLRNPSMRTVASRGPPRSHPYPLPPYH